MADWIRKGERVERTEYRREFGWLDLQPDLTYREGDGGWSFPCDEHGELTGVPDIARENYARCLTGQFGVRKVVDRGIVSWVERYWEPGILRCQCGAEVEIYMTMTNTCEKCGTDYNMSGQRLAPREQWGWDTGESLGEILAADRPLGSYYEDGYDD